MNTLAPSTWAMKHKCSALICLFSFSLFLNNLFAQQPPKIEWDRTLGGGHFEELNSIVPVDDGLVFGGTTQSLDWIYPDNDTIAPDYTLFKLDFDGNLLWKQSYGGASEDRVWTLVQTEDKGFLIGGYSKSDSSGNKTDTLRGNFDFWIVRTDSLGNKLWDKSYGGSNSDELYSILSFPNGDFLLTGISASGVSGDKTQVKRGNFDLWILRINSVGDILWQKTIGGNGYDRMNSNRAVEFGPDGNVYIAGGTTSNRNSYEISNDIKYNGSDFWLVKIDPDNGNMFWNRRYGGDDIDLAYGLRLSRDKSFFFLYGESQSLPVHNQPNGKKAPYLGTPSDNYNDFWLIKVDLDGNKLPDFDLTFGGTGNDGLYDINENIYGDIILGGYSDSPKMDGLGDHDYKIIAIDKFGAMKWDWNIGGDSIDAMTNIKRLDDGSMVFIGHSTSNISEFKSEDNLGRNDFWIVKTHCNVNAEIRPYPLVDPCAGEPLTLEIVAFDCDSCLYYWEDFGHIGTTYELPPGFNDSVSVFVADEHACIAYDTGNYHVFDPLDFSFEPKDTFFYLQQSVTIGGNNPDLQYVWNTGDTTSSLVIAHSGIYTLTVTDENGCTVADWIRVREAVKDAVYIPNAFTPDFDGANDYFNIYTDYSVRKIVTFQVYDRWGSQLFKRDNFAPNYETDGWDGTFQGRRMLPGSYKYAIIVEYVNGDRAAFDGMITIVR